MDKSEKIVTEAIDQTMEAIFASDHNPNLHLRDTYDYHRKATAEPFDEGYALHNIVISEIDFNVHSLYNPDLTNEGITANSIIIRNEPLVELQNLHCDIDVWNRYHLIYRFFGWDALPANVKCQFGEYYYEYDEDECGRCGKEGLHILNSSFNICNDCNDIMDTVSQQNVTYSKL